VLLTPGTPSSVSSVRTPVIDLGANTADLIDGGTGRIADAPVLVPDAPRYFYLPDAVAHRDDHVGTAQDLVRDWSSEASSLGSRRSCGGGRDHRR
jgi:hypothetical protein